MVEQLNPEKGPIKDIFELISNLLKNTKLSLDKLKLNTLTGSDLLGLQQSSRQNQPQNPESNPNKENNEINLQNLNGRFKDNATNLTIDRIDGTNFFEVSYTDKSSGSKVKGIIPLNWNGDSNIYMPGDRSGIAETMRDKHFKENITGKSSKKARFIFEGDANQINGSNKGSRYNNVINNFEDMIKPITAGRTNPKITIIGHSRAGKTVDSLIGKYPSAINNYIILDGTYGVYQSVMRSKIPGKIFYTNGGRTTTKDYISKSKDKQGCNFEVIGDYATLNHEAIVSKVLFEDPNTNLFA